MCERLGLDMSSHHCIFPTRSCDLFENSSILNGHVNMRKSMKMIISNMTYVLQLS